VNGEEKIRGREGFKEEKIALYRINRVNRKKGENEGKE
jgi:hypothetical protein